MLHGLGINFFLVEAQGSGKVMNEEELAFLVDPGVAEARVVLMANLSSYGSDVLSGGRQSLCAVGTSETKANISRTGGNNLAAQDMNSSSQQDAMILSVFEQLSNQVTNCNKVNKDNLMANESLYAELERYKEWEKELLTETFNVLKNESKEKETKNIDKEIALKKKVKELDNIVYKMGQSAQIIRPMLYGGSVIVKETNMISIADSEETLMLEEESRSKMLLKQSDPIVLEKKVNIKPINY
nr:hypothetical protein [Tanacetum cinerariifolium]